MTILHWLGLIVGYLVVSWAVDELMWQLRRRRVVRRMEWEEGGVVRAMEVL